MAKPRGQRKLIKKGVNWATKESAFILRKSDRVGAHDAEDDFEYLAECFVDTGDLDLLLDVGDIRQIVLGRTGSGKSALLTSLRRVREDQSIEISPENLALTYVSNSTILLFFSKLGVNLEPFYKLLWRHVLTIEVLSHHFDDHIRANVNQRTNLYDWVKSLFRSDDRKDRDMHEAIEYLEKWGKKFWLETEYRVREITENVETQLKAELGTEVGINFVNLNAGLSAFENVSKEKKADLIHRAQKVISSAQVHDLTKVISLLDRILDDKHKAYHIVIDKLDENWVEDRVRYDLIMALIQTAKDFMKVRNAKVVIALRRDLLERVFRLSRRSGFQEEKYQSLYLPLVWSNEELIGILDRRIRKLVSSRTAKHDATHKFLLPRTIQKIPIADYITIRAPRPRDIITFFNCCIDASVGKKKLSQKEVITAEGEYSRSRLRALGDEWISDYPDLLEYTNLLHKRPASFKLGVITEIEVSETCLRICVSDPSKMGELKHLAKSVVDCDIEASEFRNRWAHILYKVGLIGLKIEAFESESWVDESGRGVAGADVDESTSIVVHPAYYRALGIRL